MTTKITRRRREHTLMNAREHSPQSQPPGVLLVWLWCYPAALLDAATTKTRSESFKLGIWEEREEETTYRAHRYLAFISPVLAGRSPSVVEVLGGRGDRWRLDDCGEVDLAISKNQRNQETNKRKQRGYLIGSMSSPSPLSCSMGVHPIEILGKLANCGLDTKKQLRQETRSAHG